MVKDFYKAANDDISPDSELLEKVLSQTKDKRKPVFSHFRLAPIAAVIALAIVLPNLINTQTDTAKKPILPAAENDTTYFFLSGKTSEKENKKTSNYSADATSSGQLTSDDSNVVMSVNHTENFATAQASMRSAGGGSSANVPEEISAKEYFAKLGFSPDMLVLPEGLVADFDIGTKVSGDENTFTYSGDYTVSVTTSSSRETADTFLNNEQYEKSLFGDKTAVILYDGSVYRAYIIHSSGTALNIVTDMPEENLKNLLISAAQ